MIFPPCLVSVTNYMYPHNFRLVLGSNAHVLPCTPSAKLQMTTLLLANHYYCRFIQEMPHHGRKDPCAEISISQARELTQKAAVPIATCYCFVLFFAVVFSPHLASHQSQTLRPFTSVQYGHIVQTVTQLIYNLPMCACCDGELCLM